MLIYKSIKNRHTTEQRLNLKFLAFATLNTKENTEGNTKEEDRGEFTVLYNNFSFFQFNIVTYIYIKWHNTFLLFQFDMITYGNTSAHIKWQFSCFKMIRYN